VAPLLFLLLFAIIDFSLVMFSYISVRSGTSAGAREAAVMGSNPPSTQSCTIAGGPFAETEANNLICYTKSHVGLDATKTRVSIWFATTGCNGPCYAAGDPVVICTQYPASSTTRFFSSLLNNVILTSKVEIRIESTDSNMTAPVKETALSSWPASCSTS
jgi:TadE-like protein